MLDFYMICKSRKWELSAYISSLLEISIVGKIVGIRLGFCRNKCTFQKYTRDHILFFTFSHIIHEYKSGKVHIE